MRLRRPRGRAGRLAAAQPAWDGVNSILNMKVFLLASAGSGNLANENSLDLLIS
jgi:hypothetical protein